MEACRTALIRIASYSYLMAPKARLNLALQTASTHGNRIEPNSGDLGRGSERRHSTGHIRLKDGNFVHAIQRLRSLNEDYRSKSRFTVRVHKQLHVYKGDF